MQVKGSNIYLARRFAEQRGPAVWGEVRARLSESERTQVESVIASGWYALSLQHRVFDALEAALPDTSGDVMETFATFVAEHDLTRIHRLFLRLRSPAYALEKSAEYWSRFYDAGTWSVERQGSYQARGELSGIVETAPVFCRFLTAYITRMFQLAGATSGKCRHSRCLCRGDKSCVFEGSWREDADADPRSSLSTQPRPLDDG